jgi:hypothetical protein
MTQSINFTWERVANYIIEDICNYDTTKTYYLSFTRCGRWKLTSMEDYLKTLPWYDVAETQALQHVTWDLQRVTLP